MRYISARLFWAIMSIAGIVVVNFFITRILPGDPITALVGEYPAPPEYIAQLRREFGLDQSILVQLELYIAGVFTGNLGFSFVNREEVLPLLLGRAGVTLMLMIPSLIIATILGIAIAVRATLSRGKMFNSFLTAVSLVGISIPVFWLAQMLIMIFSVKLGWLPGQGISSIRGTTAGFAAFADYLRHLILPGFCITVAYLAVVARVARASMFEMLSQDYVQTARAKGLTESEVVRRHVLRNSLIPVITVVGYNFGYSLTGAILTETVFAWPGLGSLSVSAIGYRDYPVLSGIFLFAATAVVFTNLATDLLYAFVDPRLRRATRASVR